MTGHTSSSTAIRWVVCLLTCAVALGCGPVLVRIDKQDITHGPGPFPPQTASPETVPNADEDAGVDPPAATKPQTHEAGSTE